jgi:non-specific riboncleoside hydrolase
MTKRPIIIDTDPGIDDAVAIAVALNSPELEVKLITTVAGNVDVEKTTSNALKILKFFSKKVPVAKGCSRHILKGAIAATNVHGESGMDGYDFQPGDQSNLLSINAIEALRKTIAESKEKITIVAIGPLTNIALLFIEYPEVKENIKEIAMMGGTTGRGNFTPMGEFNAASDPEAARVVFESGVPIVMLGLDVGWKALVFPEDSKEIKSFNKTGEMIYSLFQHYRSHGLANGLKMYDSCAIAYLLCPEMYTFQDTYVGVETSSGLTYGMTVTDLKGYLKQPNNTKVALDIDGDVFRKWLKDAIKKCI